jgi:hypothetical protein
MADRFDSSVLLSVHSSSNKYCSGVLSSIIKRCNALETACFHPQGKVNYSAASRHS